MPPRGRLNHPIPSSRCHPKKGVSSSPRHAGPLRPSDHDFGVNRADEVKTNMFAIAAALAVVPGALEAKAVAPVAAVSAETPATAGSGPGGAVVAAHPSDPPPSPPLTRAQSGGTHISDLLRTPT